MFTKGRIFALTVATAGIVALGAPMASAACVNNSGGGSGSGTGLVNVSNVQVNPVVCGDNVQLPVSVVPVNVTVPVLNLAPSTTPGSTSGTAGC